jgi:acetyl esterase
MSSRKRVLLVLVAGLALLGVAGCTTGVATDGDATVDAKPVIYPLSLRYHGIETVSDVAYGSDRLQRMDVCLPADSAPETTTTPTGEATAGTAASGPEATAGSDPSALSDAQVGSRPAIMMIHGGSWSHGDKATAAYHAVCRYFASQGFVTFNVDYRLAPTDPFPAGLDDARRALDFVFRPSTLDAYDVDADRVGVFGGSAGGNLAAMLAVQDHESPAFADGNRIRAVAELSGPTDLTDRSTEPGGVSASFQRKQLLYLGCTSYARCPAAERASPQYQVTSDTAPFFIGHSTAEFIPSWESTRFASALRGAGVPVTLVAVRGTAHSIAQLDQAMSERVVAFYRKHLG